MWQGLHGLNLEADAEVGQLLYQRARFMDLH